MFLLLLHQTSNIIHIFILHIFVVVFSIHTLLPSWYSQYSKSMIFILSWYIEFPSNTIEFLHMVFKISLVIFVLLISIIRLFPLVILTFEDLSDSSPFFSFYFLCLMFTILILHSNHFHFRLMISIVILSKMWLCSLLNLFHLFKELLFDNFE